MLDRPATRAETPPQPHSGDHHATIQSSKFASVKQIEDTLHRLCGMGARTTGGRYHQESISTLKKELEEIDGLEVREEAFEILRWEAKDQMSLRDAGSLIVGRREIPIAGAVPMSRPGQGDLGLMRYLARDEPITAADFGRLILRDWHSNPMPYACLLATSHHKTPDLLGSDDRFPNYDRLATAGHDIARDLKDGGRYGVVGIVFMLNLPTREIESYFEPHNGTHWRVPAVMIGADGAAELRTLAHQGESGRISISAVVSKATTSNIIARLPGQSKERILYVTHTDGNTYVQENGPAALLSLARYFADLPSSERGRTLEFIFNSGHLHMSREANIALAKKLHDDYEFERDVVLVIAVEHLGAREVEALPRVGGLGQSLQFTGRGEMTIWCLGPSQILQEVVTAAVERRRLDRLAVMPGIGKEDGTTVPAYHSFGGIGTSFHQMLLPTTSIISGPWTLWIPGFGIDAVDVQRMRSQTLALGDLYFALAARSRDEIVGGYADYWRERGQGRVHHVDTELLEIDA